MSFIKKVFGNFSTQILMVLLGLANNVIVANILGAEGQGSFALFLLVPGLMVTLGNLGIGMANVYFTGSRKFDLMTLTNQSIILAATLGGILLGGFYIVVSVSGITIEPNLTRVIWVVPFSLLTLLLSNLILGLNQIRNYNLVILLPKISLFILLILFLFIFKLEIAGTSWAYFIAEVLAAILILVGFLTFLLPGRLNLKINIVAIKRLLFFGSQGFLANVLSFLNYRLDMFLILYFLNREELGFYSIAVLLVEKIWLIPNAVGTVLFPQVAANQQRQNFTPLTCRLNLLITFVVALVLFLLTDLILQIFFKPEFQAASTPLKILLPGIVLLGIPKVLAADLAGRGKPIFATITAAIAVIINVSLNWLLIPRHGIAGAALASTISYSISGICMLYFYKKITRIALGKILLPQADDWKLYNSIFKRVGRQMRDRRNESK